MKFTNSPVYNKQHFTAVACTLAGLSVGVILVAVSNDSCNRGLSAKESLRRRLPPAKDGGAYESLGSEDSFAEPSKPKKFSTDAQGNPPTNWFTDSQGNNQAYTVFYDKNGNIKNKPGSDKCKYDPHDIPLFGSKPFVCVTGIGAMLATPITWGILLFFHKEGIRLTYEEGCFGGLMATVCFVYLYVLILSQNGEVIRDNFGNNANGFIVFSSAFFLFTGASISCTLVSPEAMWVFGALAIGALFGFIFFRFIKHRPEHKGWVYAGVSTLSFFTSASAGCLIFGAHGYASDVLFAISGWMFLAVSVVGICWAVGLTCYRKGLNAGQAEA